MSSRGHFIILLRQLTFAVVAFACSSASFAGGRDRIFFSPSGKLLNIGEVDSNSIPLPTAYSNTCVDSDQLCLNWKLHVASGNDHLPILSRVQAAINVWATYSKFLFQFQGVRIDLPDHDSAPRDSNDNPIFENELLISTEPPAAWRDDLVASNEYARVFRYLIPHFDDGYAEISGVAIYLNPKFLPSPYGSCNSSSSCVDINGSGSLSLKSVLISYIGTYFLGLDASGIRDSLMFPVQGVYDGRTFSRLSTDEQIWLDEIYSPVARQAMGSIRGQVRNGSDAQALSGGYVSVLDTDILQLIADGKYFSFSDHIVTGGLVQEDGHFEIPLPPGSYVLMLEPTDGAALRPDYFNDWAKLNASNQSFPRDFYDGAGRESNKESWEASVPSMLLAARLEVRQNEVTEVSEFYTDEPNSAQEYFAVGSNNESLSEYTLEDLSSLLSSSHEQDLKNAKSSGGGCQLVAQSQIMSINFEAVLILTLMMMFLMKRVSILSWRLQSFQRQLDQKEE